LSTLFAVLLIMLEFPT